MTICKGFMPFSTLFQLYHHDSSLIHDPWVNRPALAQGDSTMTAGMLLKSSNIA